MENLKIFIGLGIALSVFFGFVTVMVCVDKYDTFSWKRFGIATVITLVLGFGFSGLMTLNYSVDKEHYNNGYCECGGEWELFDVEKGYRNSSTTYYYKCNNCKNVFSSKNNFNLGVDN